MSTPAELVLSGIKNPSDIPGFLRRKAASLKISTKNIGRRSQKQRIDNLLQEDEFLLVILDACRYDFFERRYTRHFEGNLERTYTTNTYTMQYLMNTWTDEYDITYVAGGPVVSDRNFDMSDWDYRPSEHFDEIIDVWDMGYEKELGVTPPEAITEIATKRNDDRMIVHYFQPHAPYIGEDRLREGSVDGGRDVIEARGESLKRIYEKIEAGEIDEDTLRKAYASNLQRVMEATKPLVEKPNRRTVLTSDHGEILGEDGRYMHGGVPHSALCEVPWLEVNDTKGEPKDIDTSKKQEGNQDEVRQQLEDLGYL